MKQRTRQPLTNPLDRLLDAAVRQAQATDPQLHKWLRRLQHGDLDAQARKPQTAQAGQGGGR